MRIITVAGLALMLALLAVSANVASAMNKAELIEAISSGANLSKADAKRALEALTGSTARALKKTDRVALVGFGSFSISNRAARTGRNPQTGATIRIAATNVVQLDPFLDSCEDLLRCADDGALASQVERRAKVTPDQAIQVVEIFKSFVVDNLRKGEHVDIEGFGSFVVEHSEIEKKLNLITGEIIVIPDRNVVKFKAGADLSKAVN